MTLLTVLLPAFGLAVGVGRRAVVLGATAAVSAPFRTSAATWENPFAPADRSGLKAKPLEQLRILLQDEADAIQYGGNEGLAPGGAPPATGILLIPILQMRQKLASIEPQLSGFDAGVWSATKLELSRGSFQTVEFKRVFNAFSDNIYYASGTDEANAYLLGGATPSTSQTYQYLQVRCPTTCDDDATQCPSDVLHALALSAHPQRNEALKQLGDLRDELDYQIGLPSEKRDVEYAQELMANTLRAFDAYLKLAPPEQLKTARTALDLQ